MGTVIPHSAETLRKRQVLSRVWASIVIVWAVIRTIIIWAALGDYGFNPWIYLSIDLMCATIDAITTPRMVLYFIDDRYKMATKWALVSLVAFVVPDIYIFVGTRTLPTRVIVILCCGDPDDARACRGRDHPQGPQGPRGARNGSSDGGCSWSCLNWSMKAAILAESLTGNTWKAGEMIAGHLQQAGWEITGCHACAGPTTRPLQAADLVLVGTWIHGLFVVGQTPWALGEMAKLPVMKGKKAAAFCTYALNPGTSLQKMTGVLDLLGAEVLGGLALHRAKLPQHTEEFAARLVERAERTRLTPWNR